MDIEIPEAPSTSAQMGKSEVTALGWYDKSFFFLHPEKQLNCGRNVSVVILQLNEINRPDGKMR